MTGRSERNKNETRGSPPAENERRDDRKRCRVQLECSDRALAFVDSLKQRTGATSNAEVVRHALEVYNWVQGYLERGYRLRFHNEEEVVEAYLPPIVCPPP